MISPDRDFVVFIETVKSGGYYQILYAAEQEATGTERFLYRNRRDNPPADLENARSYLSRLKAFVFFLRYGIKLSKVSPGDAELFHIVCEELLEREHFPSRLRCAG